MSLSTPTRALAGVALLGAAVVAGLVVSPSATVTAVESVAADPVLFGIVVAGLYLVRPLFAWPTTPLAVVVGYGYGVALGVPIALAGVLVTVTPVYLAARWLVTDTGAHELEGVPFGATVERAGRAVTNYYETAGPIRGVVVSRLAPIPSDVSTCGAAVSGVSLRHLLIGTAIGELPWTVAAVVVGASTASISTAGLWDVDPLLVVACTLAALALLAGPAYRVANGGTGSAGVRN